MYRWLWLAVVTMIGVGGLGFWQQQLAKPAPRGWKYCTVGWSEPTYNQGTQIAPTKFRYTVTDTAEICYEESSGCKTEAVVATVQATGGGATSIYWEPYFAQAQRAALAKALAELGASGWELVGSGPDPSAVRPNAAQYSPVAPIRVVLYLKHPAP